MDPIAALGSAYSSMKALTEVLSVVAKLNVSTEVSLKVIDALQKASDVQQQLFDAQNSLFELRAENENLRRQIKDHEDWESKKTDYRLIETPRGARVYQSVGATPLHHTCPACFTKKTIQIIQDVAGDSLDRSQCPGCNQYFAIKPETDYGPIEIITSFDP